MTDKTELEKLEKALEDQEKACEEALAALLAAEAEWNVRWDAVATCRKEQQGNAVNAAYDALRKSVLGRDYKLEQQDND